MEYISVFDMLKIGVGPSSSHTLGPWRAAGKWIEELKNQNIFNTIKFVKVHLYGSLSLTGRGHATDLAVMMGLTGADPKTVPTDSIAATIDTIGKTQELHLNNEKTIIFSPLADIIFNKNFLPFHSNGITFTGYTEDGKEYSSTFYSIGGGFVVKEETADEETHIDANVFPFPAETADELFKHCITNNMSVSEIVTQNELAFRDADTIESELKSIWNTMLQCMYDGCHTEGTLPGGLNVHRRAFDIHKKLIDPTKAYSNPEEWIDAIRHTTVKFRQILKWVSCFAIGVNEVNAALGRVVTAPTNGSAGVIPSVLMYYLTIENHKANFSHIKQFLIVAGKIGSLFKQRATISAAMGGCQAEIGVSSAMAAGALCELLGGTPAQVLVAAEIAMEHHLGLTCDPINGLVQIPCIERNSMGAIKAINAAELALETNPDKAKVPLDKVIQTMMETAKDMNSKYKETSEGGLAVAVKFSDC